MQPNSQNSDQTKQPIPDQLKDVSMRKTIQPLSPEEDIRGEVRTPYIAPSDHAGAVSGASSVDSAGNTESTHQHNSGSLIAEPLHPRSQSTTLSLRTPSTASSLEKGGGSKKIISTVIGLVILVALGIGAYLFFVGSKITAVDLIEQAVQKTSYLRPKEWQPVPIGLGLETYASSGKSGQSISSVTVNETISIQVVGSSDTAIYDQLRSQEVQKASVDSIKAAFRNGGEDCTSNIEFKAEPDTKTKDNVIGLALATGTCARGDGKYTVKMRTVIGKDGLTRQIMVAASDNDWSKNQTTFQAILDSVDQISE